MSRLRLPSTWQSLREANFNFAAFLNYHQCGIQLSYQSSIIFYRNIYLGHRPLDGIRGAVRGLGWVNSLLRGTKRCCRCACLCNCLSPWADWTFFGEGYQLGTSLGPDPTW